jgi:hypothetical protein
MADLDSLQSGHNCEVASPVESIPTVARCATTRLDATNRKTNCESVAKCCKVLHAPLKNGLRAERVP